MTEPATTRNVDAGEVAKFEAMAAEWWDPNGKFRPLHDMNPCRLDYLCAQIAAEFGRDLSQSRSFEGLRLLDIGCGGGLLAEPFARLGAEVTGIDAAGGNIPVAEAHAAAQGLRIDYRHTSAETLVENSEIFDAVIAFEVIEHVADPAVFVATAAKLARPGGLVMMSTLNRTTKAFGAAIIGAEWVMRWLPRGTHDWARFVTPEELERMMTGAGLDVVDRKGMVFDPIRWSWSLSPTDLAVNYAMTALVPEER